MAELDSSTLCYDVVIVGAGPSACGLLYGILSRHIDDTKQQPEQLKKPLPYSIAVLDRGPSTNSDTISTYRRTPSDWFNASHRDDYSGRHNLQSTPQRGLGGRIVTVPVGGGLGGSTNVNACLVSTPSSDDFEEWPEQWRGSVMTDAAQHLATAMRDNNAIEESEFDNDDDAAISGRSSGGHSSSLDPAQFPSRVSKVITSTKKRVGKVNNTRGEQHERVNYYDALFCPLLNEYPHLRECITVLDGFNVQRITFDDNETDATGVECSVVAGRHVRIRARKQVILCAGAIFSPALLLVSGIGPADVLEGQGVTPLKSEIITKEENSCSSRRGWQLVGQNLTDHVILPRAFLTWPNMWLGRSITGIQCWHNESVGCNLCGKENIAAAEKRNRLYQLAVTDGICSTQLIPHFVAALFYRGFKSKTRMSRIAGTISAAAFYSIRSILSALMVWTPIALIVKYCTATINISILNPLSKGSVSIRRKQGVTSSGSARLDDYDILVDPNYLSDIRDVSAMKQGWKLSEQIRVKYFSNCLEVLPSIVYRYIFPQISTLLQLLTTVGRSDGKDWIYNYAADFACPYFHWNGSCCMGSGGRSEIHSAASVVNDRLEVMGVKRLRICDASVFPSNISCPPALTCACLGYVASDFIRIDL